MKVAIIEEPARLLFHLNGYSKILLERTQGIGSADGDIVWDVTTDIIPIHLRKIGSRFIVRCLPLSPEEMNDPAMLRNADNRIEILELPVT